MNDSDVATKSLVQMKAEAGRCLAQRDYVTARAKYEHLSTQDPTDVESLTGLGQAYVALGETNPAIRAFKKAIQLSPQDSKPLHCLGRLLLNIGQHEKAVVALQRAVTSDPRSAAIWSDLGMAQKGANDFASTLQSLKRAMQLDRNSVFAAYNLAVCLREIGRSRDALGILETLIASKPKVVEARVLAAAILSDMSDADGAITLLQEHIATHPKNVECRQSLALIQLRAGKLGEGFDNYEWRLTPSERSVPIRPFSQSTWQGQRLETEKLLIWLEQGVGDEILSLSMLEDINRRAPNCIVECDGRLLRLLARSFPDVTFVGRSNPPAREASKADYVCPMWSTARFLRRKWDQFPPHTGYLIPDAAQVDAIRNRYKDAANGRKIIGLSWASASEGGGLKTPPLESWKPVLNDFDHFIVSLQHAPHPEDITRLNQMGQSEIVIDGDIDASSDFDMAAAQIAALDGVVTISNSTAHLSGALGVPTAAVIPEGFGGFWYWHRELNQSPWYPSMRLCRQSEPGEWPSAIVRVCDWLA